MDNKKADINPAARATINDIARLSGVSKKTVSRVINNHPAVKDETRQHIRKIMEEHNYRPDPQARALAFRRSFLIGMAYDNPSPQYVVNMQRGILDGLAGTDFQLVLHPVDRSDEGYLSKILQFVERHRPAGIIMPPSVSEDELIAQRIRELDCNFVRIASEELDDPAHMVRTHDAEGAAQAARHLAHLGHTRIAHIQGPKSFKSSHVRLAGFEQGLAEFGLQLDPELTIEAGYTFDSGLRATDNLLSMKQRPTAIFTGNDEMAVGAYTAARNAGLRIPQDLSVVGFDDTPIAARVSPPLTTVRLPIREMGRAAAKSVLQQVNKESVSTVPSFKPEIVVRQSTAKIA